MMSRDARNWGCRMVAAVGLILVFPGTRILAQTNLAWNRPVSSSGANWGSFKPGALTDGDTATFTHPAAAVGTMGFFYEVDLGGNRRLERVVLRNRGDGCCPERLSRVRVEIWSDGANGEPGERRWSAMIRGDGSNSGVSGTDTITAGLDGAGDFAGRYIRVINTSGAAYNPQLAEIEAYGGALPQIRTWEADPEVIARGESSVLRWETSGGIGGVVTPGGIGFASASGMLTVNPTTTTQYTLMVTNAHGSVTASLAVGVDVPLLPPELTEFAADNAGGIEDDDGDEPDWVEIWNPNPYAISLEGYYLTDDPADLRRWRIPAARLRAGESRVIFASGKDRVSADGTLHTNFRLRAEGDFLALVDRDGTTGLRRYPDPASGQGTYPAQRSGASYGLGSNGRVGFMRPPTPGASNAVAYVGVVQDTKFSRNRGIYEGPLEVTLSTATDQAVIRYTTDLTSPTSRRGQIYSGPIPITSTTVLRAAAFREDWAPTDIDTMTYVLASNVFSATVMRRSVTTNALYRPQLLPALADLASVSLVTETAINGDTEATGSVEWIPSARDKEAGWMDPGGVQAACGARWFGGAFTDFAKKNFRLYFRQTHGDRRFRAPVFRGTALGAGAAETFDQLELRGGSHDMSMRGFYLSNAFVDDTMLEMGHLNPRGRFVHLHLNGVYWGVYHLRERWGASMFQSYLGGTDTDYESINGNWNVGGWAEPGVPYDGDGSTWARLKAVRSNYRAAADWLDVPQFVDYMLMWMFGGAEDEYRCVGPVAPGSGFRFYLNDADGWFCIPQYCAAGNRTARGAPGRQAGDGPGSLFSMLFAGGDPDYRMLLADRIHRSLNGSGPLSAGRNRERLDRRVQEFERPFLLESARWGYLTPTEWRSRVNSARDTWLPGRTAQVLAQFRSAGWLPTLAAPRLEPEGGLVASGTEIRFSGVAGGTVLFTRDGSDPRLPGGGISAGAETAAGAMRVEANTWVRARVRSGNQWSPLTEAFFQVGEEAVGVEDLVVSELKPRRGGSESPAFLELRNQSARAINLRGASFVDGIRFAFPSHSDRVLAPGQRLLLADDLVRFHRRYGVGVRADGVFQGRLDGQGESIGMVDPEGRVLLSLEFGNDGLWPGGPGSYERSLVLVRPELGMRHPRAWRLSVADGGTPGGTDTTPFIGDPGVDRDTDGLPAIVEHAMGTLDTSPTSGGEVVSPGKDETGGFHVRVFRNLAADDVILKVEFTTDLVEWRDGELRAERRAGGDRTEMFWAWPGLAPDHALVRVSVVRR